MEPRVASEALSIPMSNTAEPAGADTDRLLADSDEPDDHLASAGDGDDLAGATEAQDMAGKDMASRPGDRAGAVFVVVRSSAQSISAQTSRSTPY